MYCALIQGCKIINIAIVNKVMHLVLPILCLLLVAQTGTAQVLNAGRFSSPIFETIKLNDGNNIKSLTCATRDQKEVLWFGTKEGLYQYNGTKFTPIPYHGRDSSSIRSKLLKDLFCDSKGQVWVCQEGYLDVYDHRSNKFTAVNSVGKDIYISEIIQIDAQHLLAAAMDRDNFLNAGIFIIDINNLNATKYVVPERLLPNGRRIHRSCTGVRQDTKDSSLIWVSTEKGLAKFDLKTKSFQAYYENPLIDEKEYAYHSCLENWDKKTLFIGSWGPGLIQFDKETGVFSRILFRTELNDDYRIVHFIKRKNAEEIWVGTGFGVLIYNVNQRKEKSWEYEPNNPHSILGFMCLDMVTDKDGAHYFCMEDGLSKYDWHANQIKYFEFFIREKLNPNFFDVTAVVESPKADKLYIAIDAGESLYELDVQNYRYELYKLFPWKNKKLEPEYITGMAFIDGENILISTKDKFQVFNTKMKKLVALDCGWIKAILPNSFGLKTMVKDNKGMIWLIGQNDFCIIDWTSKKAFHSYLKSNNQDSKYINERIHSIVFKKNNEALFATSNGFIEFDGTRFRQLLINAKDKDPINYIMGGAYDDATMTYWAIIANQGLVKLKAKGDKLVIEPQKDGSDYVLEGIYYQILKDKLGIFWLKSQHNLEIFDPKTNKSKILGSQEGMVYPVVKNYFQAMDFLPSGRLYFVPGRKNIAYLDPQNIYDMTESKPMVDIKSLKVFDKLLPMNSMNNGAIDLTYKQNFFTIQFNAIHYFKPNNIRYVHKLEGIDPDWSTEGQAQVSYTNISGGNYKFRVKAINSLGIEGPESVLDIFIEPPFWQKSWFQILFGCGLIGLVFGYIKYREIKINEKRNLEQLALQSEIKSLRSQMNPHFIFNAINTVKHKVLTDNPLQASEFLSQFALLLRKILYQTREQVVSVKEDLETLELYIALEQERQVGGFKVIYDVDETLDLNSIFIPPMLVQPFVENAIKHGLPKLKDNGLLTISIKKLDPQYTPNQCFIAIEDNGVGRIKNMEFSATNHKSLGMTITQERIDMYNKLTGANLKFEIIDKINDWGNAEGTKIIMYI